MLNVSRKKLVLKISTQALHFNNFFVESSETDGFGDVTVELPALDQIMVDRNLIFTSMPVLINV